MALKETHEPCRASAGRNQRVAEFPAVPVRKTTARVRNFWQQITLCGACAADRPLLGSGPLTSAKGPACACMHTGDERSIFWRSSSWWVWLHSSSSRVRRREWTFAGTRAVLPSSNGFPSTAPGSGFSFVPRTPRIQWFCLFTFSAYIGIGQMSRMAESELISYKWTLEQAERAKDLWFRSPQQPRQMTASQFTRGTFARAP